MYDVAMSVLSCLRAGTDVHVAWVVTPEAASPGSAVAVTPGGGRMGSVLSYVETLSKIDVTGVEPTAHPAPVLARLREADAGECLPREAVLRNAPDSAMDQVRVPKVVEDA